MVAALTILAELAALMRGQSRLRFVLAMGVAEELAALGLGVAAPFLLALTIRRMTSASVFEQCALMTAFVVSWLAPTLIGALKSPKTARLTDYLYREMSSRALRRQLVSLVEHGDADSGKVAGVLERLPLSLQIVLDGLIWRAGPLIVQLVFSVAALALALPVRYAGLLGLTLLTYLYLSNRSASRLDAEVQAFNRAASNLSADVSDVLRNADRIVCNGTVSLEVERLAKSALARGRGQSALARLLLGAVTLQASVLGVGLSFILVLAILDVRAQRIQIADLVLLQAMALHLTSPLGGLVLTVRQAVVALANINEALLFGKFEPTADRTKSPHHPGVKGLHLEAVSYAYSNGTGVFDVSIGLQPGRFVALVGVNGSGKSTLARLMAGVLPAQAGAIWVDGEPLESIEPGQRAQRVLYVPQFIGLFNRSLHDNATYPPSTQSASALRKTLDHWAFNPSQKGVALEDVAGEQGRRLSGGQIQKLELARLCAVPSAVLILDESTSALDGPSELEVLRTLRAHCAGRLLVFVTHRKSLVENVDQVLFLKQGRVAGFGTHQHLLGRHDYARLWSSGRTS